MKSRAIKIVGRTVLSRNWGTLSKIDFDIGRRDGTSQHLSREVYDRGDAAAILLYNRHKGTVVLTRQFRLPVHLEGEDGWVIEACAGLLEGDDPETCARKEAIEETGYRVTRLQHACDVYPSPGSVKEKLHLFVAEYDPADRASDGGGLAHEGEDIEVLELPFYAALAMVRSGDIKDAKTVLLLHWAALNGLFEPGGATPPQPRNSAGS